MQRPVHRASLTPRSGLSTEVRAEACLPLTKPLPLAIQVNQLLHSHLGPSFIMAGRLHRSFPLRKKRQHHPELDGRPENHDRLVGPLVTTRRARERSTASAVDSHPTSPSPGLPRGHLPHHAGYLRMCCCRSKLGE